MFETVNESDVAPEAADEAAPASAARRRLAGLIAGRDEASSAMGKARTAIQRLQGAQSLPGPIEGELAALDAAEGELMAKWSSSGGEFPALDAERRQALEEALADARNKAAGAARAIPAVEAEYTRHALAANAISHNINAAIAEIILEEIEPSLVEIAADKARLAARAALAESGRLTALRTVEAIPMANRTEIAASYYQRAAAFEKSRVAAVSPPAPAYADGATWSHLARRLACDPGATVGEG